MAESTPKPRRFLHVALDWDRTTLEVLSDVRKVRFVDAVSGFAQKLREKNVATLWVSFFPKATAYGVVDPRMPWSPDESPLRGELELYKYGFEGMPIHEDEGILVKNYRDAFQNGILDRFLRARHQVTDLIFTGGLTDDCVLASVKSALAHGYNVIVVYDCLFAMKANTAARAKPKLHMDALKKLVKIETIRPVRDDVTVGAIKYCTTQQTLDLI